ncbi:Homeodomain-like protein [Aspergillus alliaceus]|uniref:Homeodomain-like protein n=1 Tax=Petromyces alliaceus TaxID=209559 RepID=UPI0012A627B4|nr:Homeodomain-like protein [Aspergillus alliaceus]KAB8238948.1 Homeodomain-like protein [Aspergillus alliaceus]
MADDSRKWTEAEDQILEAAVRQAATPIDWLWIASRLPERSNKDCRKRWYQRFAGNTNFGSWMDAEDGRLRAAVARHGTKWPIVSKEVGTRTSDQCSKRWKHVLDPNLDHSPWTLEEDNSLLTGVEQHGRNWKMISEMYFKNRAALSLKNRHALLIRRRNRSNGLPQALSKLQTRSPSHSPKTIAMPECRNSTQQLENSAASSDDPRPFEKEIQDEGMTSKVNDNNLQSKTARYDWGDLEVATSNATFEKGECWSADPDLFLSSSPFQGQISDEGFGIGDILKEPSCGPQSVTPLRQCSVADFQDNFEGLLGSMSPLDNFTLYPNASLGSAETSPGPSSDLCTRPSSGSSSARMTAATGFDNEQLTSPMAPCRHEDWNNLFSLTVRCTKGKMEAIRQSVLETTSNMLCIEENDDDLIEMRLTVERRS